MRIGIVDMYGTPHGLRYIVGAVVSLGCEPFLLNGTRKSAELVESIQRSDIRHWICSGSPTRVTDPDSPQIPMELLGLNDKRFLMICYSMESVLVQLGVPIRKRRENRKESFHLSIPRFFAAHPLFEGVRDPMILRRNHHWYFETDAIEPPVMLVASYRGEAMIVLYKNAVLAQHHPERTVDGRRFLWNWLRST